MSNNGFINTVTDGLIYVMDPANKKSYPGTGTVFTDLVGGVSSDLVNGTTFSDNTFVTDGVNEFIRFNKTFTPNTTDFSVSIWCRLEPGKSMTSTSNLYTIFATNTTTANNGTFILYRGGTNGILICPDFTGAKQLYPSTDLKPQITGSTQLHNICIVRQTDNLYLYFNGSQVGLATGVSAWNMGSNGTNTNMGRTVNGLYDGAISAGNCFVYNRSLSASEVLQNYNATKWRYQ